MDEPKVAPEHEHCWHWMPYVFASYPGVRLRVCCHCNLQEPVREAHPDDGERHGPHAPLPAMKILGRIFD